MSRSALVRGFSGALLASLWISTACSSSDGPTTTPEGGGSLASGGSSAGAPAGGKGGKHAGGSGNSSGAKPSGGEADSPSMGGSNSAAGADNAGAGAEAGSGGQAPLVPGCENGKSCASGACSANNDCQSCIADHECADGRVCGAGQCAEACSVEQEGTSQGCGTGLTCCGQHCVSTVNDQRHCGACGTACADTQFCGQSGCVATKLSSLCQVGKLAVILDGQVGDDPTGRALSQALVDHCPSSQTSREVSQTVADALNPDSGQPVSGSDELLLIAGSDFFQNGMRYMVTNKLAPLRDFGTGQTCEIHDAATDTLIASALVSDLTDSHDLFAVQVMRDPSSDSLILNAFGFTVGGTAAATYYFTDVLAPNLAASNKAWYVGEWTDKDGDKLPDADELTVIASGG